MLTPTVRKVFRSHGEFCATQPWEVIVATLTFLVCILTVWGKHGESEAGQSPATPPAWTVMELVVMTFIRCLALLHCYYHFKKVHRVGSSLIMKITLAYLSFTMLLYSLVVFGMYGPEFENVKESWFLIMLFTDIPKVTRMAQFALTSSHQRRIPANVAVGMAQLGPVCTFETVGKVLLVGLCGLTHYTRLEQLATYAVITVIVDFLIFMSFYPAGLSLVIELMFTKAGRPQWDNKQIIKSLPLEESLNSVVYRVRVVAMTGLVIVHTLCRWPVNHSVVSTTRAAGYITSEWLKLLVENLEQFCVLAVVTALAVKYLFYEDWEENCRIRKTYLEELERKCVEEASESDSVSVDTNTSERSTLRPHTHEMDRSSNSTDEGISLSTLSNRRMSATFERRMSSTLERRLSGGKTRGGHSIPTQHQINQINCSDTAHHRVSLALGQCDTCSESPWPEEAGAWDQDSRDAAVQTALVEVGDQEEQEEQEDFEQVPRGVAECLELMKTDTDQLVDSEIIQLVDSKHISRHTLEKTLRSPTRGVRVRRKIYGKDARLRRAMEKLPYRHFDYEKVMGACCENVVGYMPVPVGVVGPLNIDGRTVQVPMATTEGCLVASTNRGCSALRGCGVTTSVTYDGMTRGPVVRFPCMIRATDALRWMENKNNFESIKAHFDSTSRFARLQRIHTRVAGRQLYIRFVARSGDAMGMNMLSKATEFAITRMLDVFPDMEIISLSGNFCTDKKPAAVNWVEGRGKSVVAEAIVPAHIVKTVLKTSTSALVDLNISKNLVGSSMAGSIGGFNAHAANIITAIYIATGQDAAQNVGSSNCITLMEAWGPTGEDLYMTCSMPSIEVGTVGGGTVLPAQSACLEMLGVKGPHPTLPGENASQLARIVCGAVLAGELSLMSALAAGHLVRSHLKHNRPSENGQNREAPLSASTPTPQATSTNSWSAEVEPLCSERAQTQPAPL